MRTRWYTTQNWNWENVRQFCINHNFYDAGSNREYERILDFVRYNHPTVENVVLVAEDIVNHSSDSLNLEEVAQMLWSESVRHVLMAL